MAASWRTWLIGSAVAVALLAAAGGLWFAHARGRWGSAVAASGVRIGDIRCAVSYHAGALSSHAGARASAVAVGLLRPRGEGANNSIV